MGNQTAQKHLDLGNQCVKENKVEQADKHYRKMIKAFPTWSKGYSIYISFLKTQNRTQQIHKTYQQAIKVIPNCSTIYYNYGVFLTKQGMLEQAKKNYLQAIKKQQNHANAHQNLAILLKNQGKYQDAAIHYQKAYQLNPDDSGICYNYAILSQKLSHYQKAQTLYRKSIYNNPNKLSSYLNFALLLKQLGRVQQARQQYQKALKIDPSNAEIFFNLGVLLQSSGQTLKALEMYQKAFDADNQMINALYNMGVLYQKMGKIQQSAEKYKKILTINPQNSDAAFNMALILKKNGADGRLYSEKYYQIVAKSQPQNPLYLCSRAQNLFSLNHKKEAFELLDKANAVMSAKSEEQIKQLYGICELNYDFIDMFLREIKKLRKMQKIEQNMNEEDRQFVQNCKEQLLSFIDIQEVPSQLLTKQYCEYQNTSKRQTLIDFDHKYYKKIKQLQQKYNYLLEQNSQLMQKLSSFEEKLMWQQKFDDKLYELEQRGQVKMANFARNLCWMLCTSIQSYRAVGIGVVEAGDNLILSKTGDFVQNLSCLCGTASKVPIVGKIIHVFAQIAEFYVQKDRKYCGQKIIDVTSRLYSQRKVLKAVTDMVQELIQSKNFIQNFKIQEQKDLFQIIKQKFSDFTHQLIGKVTQIKMEKNDELAFAYCMRIMCGLLDIQGRPSNPIMVSMTKIIGTADKKQ